MEIITAIKEHEAHMAITNHLPTGAGGGSDDGSKTAFFAGKQQKQGGVQRSASKTEVNWGNSKGKDGVCFCCWHPGHVTTKCIADMPQEVKDCIISGAAHVVREDELDGSADDDMTEIVVFTRDNPHTYALMANALQPVCDHRDKTNITQEFTENTHIALDTQ